MLMRMLSLVDSKLASSGSRVSQITMHYYFEDDKDKSKEFPYSLPSVGPGADPGVQAVSPQVTWSESRHRLAVGCHYFLPGWRWYWCGILTNPTPPKTLRSEKVVIFRLTQPNAARNSRAPDPRQTKARSYAYYKISYVKIRAYC